MARMHYLKFYPDSWVAENSLRLCSLAARGLWIELICRMAQSPEHGVLLGPGGKPVRDDQIAALVGSPHDGVMAALVELGENGVFSRRTPDGAIYCRRMVRDHERYVRQAESGSRGGRASKSLEGSLKGTLKGSLEGCLKASVDSRFSLLSSSSEGGCKGETPNGVRSKKAAEDPPGFAEFWAAWPKSDRKKDRGRCAKLWASKCLGDLWASEIQPGLDAWKRCREWTKDGGAFICAPEVWLGNSRWREGPADTTPATKPATAFAPDPQQRVFRVWWNALEGNQRPPWAKRWGVPVSVVDQASNHQQVRAEWASDALNGQAGGAA